MTAAPLRTTPAPVCARCGSAGRLAHTCVEDRILSAPGQWTIRACDCCALTWLDPQPHPDDLGLLYRGSYMTHAASVADTQVSGAEAWYLGAAYGYARPAPGSGGSWLRGVRPLDDVLGGHVCWLPATAGGTLLDVGCGSGAFLARMRGLGWQVAGVEPDPAAAAEAKRVHGIAVEPTLVGLGGRRFDAVTMHHVIEHLPDPHREVATIVSHLEPGGRLVIVTPNIQSAGRRRFGANWVHWDPPRHLWMFSLRALRDVVTSAGLDVERSWTTGRYARFVSTASGRIAAGGRVTDHARSLGETAGAVAFQLSEQALGLVSSELGEELVVVARRRA